MTQFDHASASWELFVGELEYPEGNSDSNLAFIRDPAIATGTWNLMLQNDHRTLADAARRGPKEFWTYTMQDHTIPSVPGHGRVVGYPDANDDMRWERTLQSKTGDFYNTALFPVVYTLNRRRVVGTATIVYCLNRCPELERCFGLPMDESRLDHFFKTIYDGHVVASGGARQAYYQEGTGGVNCYVHFLGGQDIAKSFQAVINTTNPVPGSYVYIFPNASLRAIGVGLEPKLYSPVVIDGPSCGMALYAAIMGIPPQWGLFTGQLPNIAPGTRMWQNAKGQYELLKTKIAMNVWGAVEDVDLKSLFAVYMHVRLAMPTQHDLLTENALRVVTMNSKGIGRQRAAMWDLGNLISTTTDLSIGVPSVPSQGQYLFQVLTGSDLLRLGDFYLYELFGLAQMNAGQSYYSEEARRSAIMTAHDGIAQERDQGRRLADKSKDYNQHVWDEAERLFAEGKFTSKEDAISYVRMRLRQDSIDEKYSDANLEKKLREVEEKARTRFEVSKNRQQNIRKSLFAKTPMARSATRRKTKGIRDAQGNRVIGGTKNSKNTAIHKTATNSRRTSAKIAAKGLAEKRKQKMLGNRPAGTAMPKSTMTAAAIRKMADKPSLAPRGQSGISRAPRRKQVYIAPGVDGAAPPASAGPSAAPARIARKPAAPSQVREDTPGRIDSDGSGGYAAANFSFGPGDFGAPDQI